MAWVSSIPAWLCVAFGGFCGTAARAGVDLAATGGVKVAAFAWSTVLVNLFGAFFLGFVTAWAQGYFREDTVRRKVMLVAGSGCAGALTTYATMIVASVHGGLGFLSAPAGGPGNPEFSVQLASAASQFALGMCESLLLLVCGIGLAVVGWIWGQRSRRSESSQAAECRPRREA